MLLKFQNLGPVKNGEINLGNRFNLIFGFNNTGKTYLAYLIYGVLNFNKRTAKTFLGGIKIDWELFYQTKKLSFNIRDFFIRNTDFLVEEFINENIQDKTFLSDIFNTDYSFFRTTAIKVVNSITDIDKHFNDYFEPLEFNIFNYSYITVEKAKNTSSITICLNNNSKEPDKQLVKINVENAVYDSLIYALLGEYAYFALAERNAINILSKEYSLFKLIVAEEITKNKKFYDLYIDRTTRYPKPITDNIYLAEDLFSKTKNKSGYLCLAEELEKNILQGKISITSDGEIRYLPESQKKDFSIQHTGTLIKSLASIIFYFRHLAKRNDTLIIDEPELNLHPKNQIILTRILAKAANSGIKVIISTHSDFIVKEINNLLMLSGDIKNKASLLKKLGYSKDEILEKEKTGVYQFSDNEVKEIEKDKFGIVSTTFDETIDELNMRSELIGRNIK